MINLTHNRFSNVSPRKLLLIEDDDSVVSSLRLLLKAEYEIHSESSVASGVARFRELSPSLVVLDLRLPDGEGLEVLKRIRQEDTKTPVVVLTGYASLRTVEESLRLGASDYLHKPFDGLALKSRIAELLPASEGDQLLSSPLNSAQIQKEIAALKLKADSSAMFLHDAASSMTAAMSSAQFLCDLIERRLTSDADALEAAQLLKSSLSFLHGLFEQRRAIENLRRLPHSLTSLSKIIEMALRSVESEALEREVAVVVNVRCPEYAIRINQSALVRVLVNLLKNAIEAVEPKNGRVCLSANPCAGFVEFSVEDNGPGISREAQAHIFEPRFTTKERGTGLGLYISKHLIANLSGQLTLRSDPGLGCCFTIRFDTNYD